MRMIEQGIDVYQAVGAVGTAVVVAMVGRVCLASWRDAKVQAEFDRHPHEVAMRTWVDEEVAEYDARQAKALRELMDGIYRQQTE